MKLFTRFALALALVGPCIAPAYAGTQRPLVLKSGAIQQVSSGDTIALPASVTGAASINIPHGTAPTSPNNGDCWTTTAGPYCRINGVTVGPYVTTEAFCVATSDETTAITTGTAKLTFRMPYAFTLTAVRASLNTASSSGLPTFDLKQNGTSVFSTLLSIDVSELTSVTAATPAVISTSSLSDDANMTIDITVAGTGAKGAKLCLIGHQ